MKKFTLSILFASIALTAFCTTWTITNSGDEFVPETLTITEGDTVIFDLENSHNSVEVSETTWNANGITPLAGGWITSFGGGMVLPADLTVGTHWYVCQPHAAFGMKGIIIVEETTSTRPTPQAPQFSLYPNPSTGDVQLTIENWTSGKNLKVEVYDIHGVQVYTKSYAEIGVISQIELTNMASGIYFVRIYSELGMRSRMVVIQ